MKENSKVKVIDVITILGVVMVAIVVCNLLTPWLYRHIENDRTRTTVMLNKLKDPAFKPDIIVFGSSKSMMGVNGYQMTKELGQDVYNFSSTGQPPVESSLYYAMLPSSVKMVVQIIYPPVNKVDATEAEPKFGKNIATAFLMGGYHLTQDIKEINRNIDLSELEKGQLMTNFDARGAIIVPALTTLLIPRNKAASSDLKFCNPYLTLRHAMYERTIEQGRNTHPEQDITIDTAALETLEGYAQYLGRKGIKMIVVLMPCNPDTQAFTEAQMQMIGDKCREHIPDALVLNYLSAIKDTQLFFDGAHLNKNGAAVITSLLDKDLKAQGFSSYTTR